MTGGCRHMTLALLAAGLAAVAAMPVLAEGRECSSCTARHLSLQALQAARTGQQDARTGAAAVLPPAAGAACADAAGTGACPVADGATAAGAPPPRAARPADASGGR